MAKKISKSVKTAPKTEKKVIKEPKVDQSMTSKVAIKNPQDSEKVSRIVGSIFIALGVLLVAFGVYSFIKYNSTPKLDASLVPPSLNQLVSATNASKLALSGDATGYDTVYIYVNDEQNGTAKVNNKGKFTYDLTLDNEGEYKIGVAGVKGFPIRHLSNKSDIQTVVIDRTAPQLVDMDYPTEVGTSTFTVVGTAEPNSQVIIKRGIDYYSVTCNDKGHFKVASIALEEGDNVFNMVIKDTAGNETTMMNKIKVIYSLDSSVDGDAVDNTNIPVAAGNLDFAKDFINGNNLVWGFVVLAILSGVASTSVMYLRNKRS